MTFQQLKDGVRAEAGIAVSDAKAGEMVNEKYIDASARAEFNLQEIDLGDTVAQQERYTLSDTILDLPLVMVNNEPYGRVSTITLFQIKAGNLDMDARLAGVIAPTYAGEGVESFALYPIPSASGLDLKGLASVDVTPLTGTQVPIFPTQFHPGIRDGAIGEGLARIDERLDSANWYLGRYEQMVDELSRWKVKRVMGGGPVQAQLAGLHF